MFRYGLPGWDIFGGEVYGMVTEGGNIHCYNYADDCVLT